MSNLSADNATLRRLEICGLTSAQYMPIVNLIDKWVSNSGEEETVKRLKNLKVAFLHHLAGQQPPRNQWIKYHRNGIPVGPFGVLWKISCTPKKTVGVWNALMIYTSFKTSRVTQRQWKKFSEGVCRGGPEEDSLDNARKFMYMGLRQIRGKLTSIDLPEAIGSPLIEYPVSGTKRSPSSPWRYGGSLEQGKSLIDSTRFISVDLAFWQECPHILSGTLKGLEEIVARSLSAEIQNENFGFTKRPVIGRLAFIQERGYKLRAIANPALLHQAALKPLADYLRLVDSVMPGSYDMDQEGGRRKAQERLRSQGYAYSMDISGASDNLPLSLQIDLLEWLGVDEEWVRYVELCSTSDWLVPEEILGHDSTWFKLRGKPLVDPRETGKMRWTVGNPLGLRCSFFLFSIFLNAISLGVSWYLREDDINYHEDQDYVGVGDDRVYFRKEVADLVKGLFEDMGVSISPEKSIESDRLCEFTSRVVTPSSIIPGPKWGPIDDENFFVLTRFLGPITTRALRWRQRRVVYHLEEVPEEFGGLGWNPMGKSYDQRAKPFRELAYYSSEEPSKLKSLVDSLMSYAYSSELVQEFGLASINFDAEDVQSQNSFLSKYFPLILNDQEKAMIGNLADVLARLRDIQNYAAVGETKDSIRVSKAMSFLPKVIRDRLIVLYSETSLFSAVSNLIKEYHLHTVYVPYIGDTRPLSTLQQLENLIKSALYP